MTATKPGRGKYTPTPMSVTFPATFPNAEYAGKTVTWKGRGRRPSWYEIAQDAGLIAKDEVKAKKADTPADTAPAASDSQAQA